MPLLKGKCFPPVKSLVTIGTKDTVYVIPHTNEQFVSKEEFDKRVALYKEPIWTCQCTGATKLTHHEALDSEQKALKQLNSTFPVIFEKPVLELVHLSANPLDVLVDRASSRLYEQLVIGEHVSLKVTSQGSSLQGVVVKMDTSATDKPSGPVTSSPACSENVEANTDDARKKFKLLPYKYSVKLDGQDSIINGIPSTDLIRQTHVPNRDLIRLFIRARAVRSGTTFCSAYVVDENYVRKHSLQRKNFASPQKTSHTTGAADKSSKEQKSKNSSMNTKGSLSDGKPKVKQSLENKLNNKAKKRKQSLPSVKNCSKDQTSTKKARKRLLVDTDGSVCSDTPLVKLAKKSVVKGDDDDDDDVVLAVFKKESKKKKVPTATLR